MGHNLKAKGVNIFHLNKFFLYFNLHGLHHEWYIYQSKVKKHSNKEKTLGWKTEESCVVACFYIWISSNSPMDDMNYAKTIFWVTVIVLYKE